MSILLGADKFFADAAERREDEFSNKVIVDILSVRGVPVGAAKRLLRSKKYSINAFNETSRIKIVTGHFGSGRTLADVFTSLRGDKWSKAPEVQALLDFRAGWGNEEPVYLVTSYVSTRFDRIV